MARFKDTDNTQGQFMAVNLKEQLLPDTFEWTIDYLVNKADMSLFEKKYNNDERGAAAYPPRALLKIILYCYSRGIITSRKIEKACRDSIIVKALAEDCEPDHDTIATFISTNGGAVKDLFGQILTQCAQLNLITREMFAVDGCKLPSNASKEWSGTIKELRKKRDKLKEHIEKVINRHREMDKDEKAKKIQRPYAKTLGDNKERRERSIERLENKLKKLNTFLKEAEPRTGAAGEEVKSNITDNESALIKSPRGYIQGYNGIAVADSGSQIIVSAEVTGSGPESGSFPKMLDSLEENMKKATGKEEPLKKALLEGDTGYFSEANLRAAAERGIEVIIPDPQFRQRDPYFAEKKKEKAGKKRFGAGDFEYNEKTDSYKCPCGKVLEYKYDITLRNNSGRKYHAKRADCAECPLIERCIARRNGKRPFRTLYIVEKKYKENLSEKMREKIDHPAWRELYSRRMQIIEPVYSNITYCKGMNRFTLRGSEKVGTQWKLYCMVHNIGKCVKPLGERCG
ncbi:MAG: IS1182 family transposase [Treponema sp.]|jgi:transposase|nr:IS1182 family transposase [Treponema sp.]